MQKQIFFKNDFINEVLLDCLKVHSSEQRSQCATQDLIQKRRSHILENDQAYKVKKSPEEELEELGGIDALDILKKHKTEQGNTTSKAELKKLSIYFEQFQNLDMCASQGRFEENINKMLRHSTIQTASKGDFIFHIGEKNENLYFVLSGQVASYVRRSQNKKTSKSTQKHEGFHLDQAPKMNENSLSYILTLNNAKLKDYFDVYNQWRPLFARNQIYDIHSCFGQSVLKFKRNSAVALSDKVELLKISFSDFNNVFDYIQKKREFILPCVQRVFQDLISEAVYEEFISLFYENGSLIPTGEYLFKEGDPGDKIFLVKEGTFQLLKRLRDGKGKQIEKSISVLEAGELFGFESWMGIKAIDDSPEENAEEAAEAVEELSKEDSVKPEKSQNIPHEFSCKSTVELGSVYMADVDVILKNDSFAKVVAELKAKANQKKQFYESRLVHMRQSLSFNQDNQLLSQLALLQSNSNQPPEISPRQSLNDIAMDVKQNITYSNNPIIHQAIKILQKRVEIHKHTNNTPSQADILNTSASQTQLQGQQGSSSRSRLTTPSTAQLTGSDSPNKVVTFQLDNNFSSSEILPSFSRMPSVKFLPTQLPQLPPVDLATLSSRKLSVHQVSNSPEKFLLHPKENPSRIELKRSISVQQTRNRQQLLSYQSSIEQQHQSLQPSQSSQSLLSFDESPSQQVPSQIQPKLQQVLLKQTKYQLYNSMLPRQQPQASNPDEKHKWEGYKRGIEKIEKELAFKISESSQKEELPKVVQLVAEGLPTFEESKRFMTVLHQQKTGQKVTAAFSSRRGQKMTSSESPTRENREDNIFNENLRKIMAKKKKRGELFSQFPEANSPIKIFSKEVQSRNNSQRPSFVEDHKGLQEVDKNSNQEQNSEMLESSSPLSPLKLRCCSSFQIFHCDPQKQQDQSMNEDSTPFQNNVIVPDSLLSQQQQPFSLKLLAQQQKLSVQQLSPLQAFKNSRSRIDGSIQQLLKCQPSSNSNMPIYKFIGNLASRRENSNKTRESENISLSQQNDLPDKSIIAGISANTQVGTRFNVIQRTFNENLLEKNKQQKSLHKKLSPQKIPSQFLPSHAQFVSQNDKDPLQFNAIPLCHRSQQVSQDLSPDHSPEKRISVQLLPRVRGSLDSLTSFPVDMMKQQNSERIDFESMLVRVPQAKSLQSTPESSPLRRVSPSKSERLAQIPQGKKAFSFHISNY